MHLLTFYLFSYWYFVPSFLNAIEGPTSLIPKSAVYSSVLPAFVLLLWNFLQLLQVLWALHQGCYFYFLTFIFSFSTTVPNPQFPLLTYLFLPSNRPSFQPKAPFWHLSLPDILSSIHLAVSFENLYHFLTEWFSSFRFRSSPSRFQFVMFLPSSCWMHPQEVEVQRVLSDESVVYDRCIGF